MQKRYQLVWLTRRMQVRDHRNVNPIKHMRGYRTETKTYRLFTTNMLNSFKLNTFATVRNYWEIIDQKISKTLNAHVVLCRHVVGCVTKFRHVVFRRHVPERFYDQYDPFLTLLLTWAWCWTFEHERMIEPDAEGYWRKFNLHWGFWFERGCLWTKTWTGHPVLTIWSRVSSVNVSVETLFDSVTRKKTRMVI